MNNYYKILFPITLIFFNSLSFGGKRDNNIKEKETIILSTENELIAQYGKKTAHNLIEKTIKIDDLVKIQQESPIGNGTSRYFLFDALNSQLALEELFQIKNNKGKFPIITFSNNENIIPIRTIPPLAYKLSLNENIPLKVLHNKFIHSCKQQDNELILINVNGNTRLAFTKKYDAFISLPENIQNYVSNILNN